MNTLVGIVTKQLGPKSVVVLRHYTRKHKTGKIIKFATKIKAIVPSGTEPMDLINKKVVVKPTRPYAKTITWAIVKTT